MKNPQVRSGIKEVDKRRHHKLTLQVYNKSAQPDPKTHFSFKYLNKENIDRLKQLNVSLKKSLAFSSLALSNKFHISIELSL